MELRASSRVPGTSDGTASVTVILDTAAPILTLEAVTTPTQLLTQTITGSYVEPSPDVLEIFVNGVLKKSVKSFNEDSTFSELVTLSAGANLVESSSRTRPAASPTTTWAPAVTSRRRTLSSWTWLTPSSARRWCPPSA